MMSSSLFFRDDRPTYGTCRRRAVGEIADFLFCFFLHYSLVVFSYFFQACFFMNLADCDFTLDFFLVSSSSS
jgi:hypothetical protein